MADLLMRVRATIVPSPVLQIMVFIVVFVTVLLAGECLGLIPD